MKAKETIQSVADYTNSLVEQKLSLVPQVNRLEKVLFESEDEVVANTNISLSNKLTDYDEIMLVSRLSNGGVRATAIYPIEEVFGNNNEIGIGQSIKDVYLYYIQMVATSDQVFTIKNVNISNQWKNQSISVILKRIVGIKYVNPNSYSTDEQMIGYWIDGKPLYRKCYDFGTFEGKSVDIVVKTMPSGISVVKAYGTAIKKDSSKNTYNSVILQTGDNQQSVTETNLSKSVVLYIYVQNDTSSGQYSGTCGLWRDGSANATDITFQDVKVIIEYTKSTD